MAKRILVALDRGTPPSALLDLVRDAAAGGGATVRLLHVAPFPQNLVDADDRVVAYSDQEAARVEAEALDDLRTIELHFGGMPVDSVVRFGDPVHEILAEADEFDAELIARATRLRPGVKRWCAGSVAEQVGRRAPMAVALVRTENGHDDYDRKAAVDARGGGDRGERDRPCWPRRPSIRDPAAGAAGAARRS